MDSEKCTFLNAVPSCSVCDVHLFSSSVCDSVLQRRLDSVLQLVPHGDWTQFFSWCHKATGLSSSAGVTRRLDSVLQLVSQGDRTQFFSWCHKATGPSSSAGVTRRLDSVLHLVSQGNWTQFFSWCHKATGLSSSAGVTRRPDSVLQLVSQGDWTQFFSWCHKATGLSSSPGVTRQLDSVLQLVSQGDRTQFFSWCHKATRLSSSAGVTRRPDSFLQLVPHGDRLAERGEHLFPVRQLGSAQLRADDDVSDGRGVSVWVLLHQPQTQLHRLQHRATVEEGSRERCLKMYLFESFIKRHVTCSATHRNAIPTHSLQKFQQSVQEHINTAAELSMHGT